MNSAPRRWRLLASLSIFALAAGCAGQAPLVTQNEDPTKVEITDLRTNIQLLRDSLSETQRERDDLRAAHESAKVENESLEAALMNFESRYRIRMQELTTQRRELKETKDELSLSKVQMAKLDELARSFSQGKEQLTAQTSTLQTELTKARDALLEMQKKNKSLEKQLGATKEEVSLLAEKGNEIPSAVTQQMAELRRENKELSKKVGDLESSLNGVQSQHETALAAAKAETKQALAAAKKAEDEKIALQKAKPKSIDRGTKSAKDSGSKTVAARTGKPKPAIVPAAPKEEAKPQSAIAFLMNWGKTSFEDARAGKWNNDNITLASVLGFVLLLFLFAFVTHIRLKRARRALRRSPVMPAPAPDSVKVEAPSMSEMPTMVGPAPGSAPAPAAAPTVAVGSKKVELISADLDDKAENQSEDRAPAPRLGPQTKPIRTAPKVQRPPTPAPSAKPAAGAPPLSSPTSGSASHPSESRPQAAPGGLRSAPNAPDQTVVIPQTAAVKPRPAAKPAANAANSVEKGVEAKPTVVIRKPGAGDPADEDALIQDLQRMIQKNFSGQNPDK